VTLLSLVFAALGFPYQSERGQGKGSPRGDNTSVCQRLCGYRHHTNTFQGMCNLSMCNLKISGCACLRSRHKNNLRRGDNYVLIYRWSRAMICRRHRNLTLSERLVSHTCASPRVSTHSSNCWAVCLVSRRLGLHGSRFRWDGQSLRSCLICFRYRPWDALLHV
jgi:hypothetical protein